MLVFELIVWGNKKMFDKIISQVSQTSNPKKSIRKRRWIIFSKMSSHILMRMSMISEKEIKEKRKRIRFDVPIWKSVSFKFLFHKESLSVPYEITAGRQNPSLFHVKGPENQEQLSSNNNKVPSFGSAPINDF